MNDPDSGVERKVRERTGRRDRQPGKDEENRGKKK